MGEGSSEHMDDLEVDFRRSGRGWFEVNSFPEVLMVKAEAVRI